MKPVREEPRRLSAPVTDLRQGARVRCSCCRCVGTVRFVGDHFVVVNYDHGASGVRVPRESILLERFAESQDGEQ